MDILLAEVVLFSDTELPNTLNVRLKDINPATGEMHLIGEVLPVTYTSPYWTATEGGFLAFPQVGTEVLICKAKLLGTYYYLQSVVDNFSLGLTDNNLRRASGTPMRKSFLGERGSGLVIFDEYTGELINIGTQLQSATGKKVSLNDNPGLDNITIDNGYGDVIKVTGTPKGGLLSKVRSFLVRMKNDIDFFSWIGSFTVRIRNGGNINLVNHSDGVSPVTGTVDKQKGNINLQTDHNDINLFTKGKGGSIFIECLNKDSGEVNIINIETNGPDSIIRLKSAGVFEIESDNDINLKAKGNINMQGTEIHLNSDVISTNPYSSNYGNEGVE
tara:strand:+ start:3807 stop:4796 length:990 start_codon:yes stop_codon:yes gene_type:complete